MRREVDTYEVALLVKPLDSRPYGNLLGDLGLSDSFRHAVHAEKRVHCRTAFSLYAGTIADEDIKESLLLGRLGKVLLALEFGEAVECARQCQAFKVLAVASLQVDALDKIIDALVGAIRLALLDDAFYGTFTYALHAAKSETDVAPGVDGEFEVALVHIGAKYVDAHCFTFVHELGDFVNAREVTRKVGGHVLWRVVGFEVGGLIGYP